MKKITKWRNNLLHGLLALFLTFTMSSQSWGQAIIEENFDYTIGSLLTDNGWTNHSGTYGFITVTDGLSFNGYMGSGIGGAAGLDENGEDVNRTFTPVTSGTIYAAMIIKTSATNASGYFFHFGLNPWSTSVFFTRIWVNSTGDGLALGGSTAPSTWVPITPETPTLVVVKYNTDTKESSLYVFNTMPTSEPTTADGTFAETADISLGVGGIGLRQFNAAEKVTVDGIRVATTWADAVASAVASTEANILTFTLAEQTTDATINATDHTVSIEVVNGTAVTALVPTITVSAGATVSPASGVAHDFTSAVTYTVTAEDGTTTQDWVVTVTVAAALSDEANILTFSFPEEASAAVINATDTTVTSVVKWDADLTTLEPTITVSIGAQVTATTLPVDFTTTVIYRVTAQDMTTTKDWKVTVTKEAEPNHNAEITAFELAQLSEAATIDSASATVTGVLKAGTDVTSLTPTITVSEGAQVTPTAAQDFTSPVVYTVTAEDGIVTKDWTVTFTVLPTPMVTIHDIQFTEDASGDSPSAGQFVKTKGVVTGVTTKGFYIQDGNGAWNGVYVYKPSPTVVSGDSVLVEGGVQEYYKLTEISTPTVTVLNQGNTLPDPQTVALADYTEAYEGVLTQISDISCAVIADTHNEWIVENASTDSLKVGAEMLVYAPTLGEQFSKIIGIGTYTYSEFKILPRTAADLIGVSVNDDQLAMVKMYPNPVSGQLTLENMDGVATLTISNILGQTMNTFTVNNSVMSIDMSNLNNGIYILTLKSADGTMRSERIIKK